MEVAGFPATRSAVRKKTRGFRGRKPVDTAPAGHWWTPRHGHDRASSSLEIAPKKSAPGKPDALLNYDRADEVKPRRPRPRPHRHGETTAEH
jgi:hypothetical protein